MHPVTAMATHAGTEDHPPMRVGHQAERDVLPDVVALAGFILLSQAAGILGTLVEGQSAMYRDLTLPTWAPPGGVFAPVWVVLYTLMGLAAWLVWRTGKGPQRRDAMAWFGAQLLVNATWTPVFFGWESLVGGLLVLVVLLPLVVATLIAFGKRSNLAAALLVPYLLWVAYALALNASIVYLNW